MAIFLGLAFIFCAFLFLVDSPSHLVRITRLALREGLREWGCNNNTLYI
jgi:hypothetical protein